MLTLQVGGQHHRGGHCPMGSPVRHGLLRRYPVCQRPCSPAAPRDARSSAGSLTYRHALPCIHIGFREVKNKSSTLPLNEKCKHLSTCNWRTPARSSLEPTQHLSVILPLTFSSAAPPHLHEPYTEVAILQIISADMTMMQTFARPGLSFPQRMCGSCVGMCVQVTVLEILAEEGALHLLPPLHRAPGGTAAYIGPERPMAVTRLLGNLLEDGSLQKAEESNSMVHDLAMELQIS